MVPLLLLLLHAHWRLCIPRRSDRQVHLRVLRIARRVVILPVRTEDRLQLLTLGRRLRRRHWWQLITVLRVGVSQVVNGELEGVIRDGRLFVALLEAAQEQRLLRG